MSVQSHASLRCCCRCRCCRCLSQRSSVHLLSLCVCVCTCVTTAPNSPPSRSVSVHDEEEEDNQSGLSSQISTLRLQMAQMQRQEEQEKKEEKEQYERVLQQASFIAQQQSLPQSEQPQQQQPQQSQPQPQQSQPQQSQPQPQQSQPQQSQERDDLLARLANLERQQEARKRVREVEEGPLPLGPRKVSPNDSAVVRYGEAKLFVLQRSDMHLRVQMLNMEIDSLRGNFIRTPEDERIVKKATLRAEAKWTKEGVSKTIRDRRKVVLNTLRMRLVKEEHLFEEQRKRIKMLRLQVCLQHVRVQADEDAGGAEEREEERMYRLRIQENKLKAAKQQANIDKQQRKLSMTFGVQMPTAAAAAAAAAAGIRVGAAASKPRIRRRIVVDDEDGLFADDVDDLDEEAQHALEDAEERATAALEQENDDDRAFIASEDEF